MMEPPLSYAQQLATAAELRTRQAEGTLAGPRRLPVGGPLKGALLGILILSVKEVGCRCSGIT